jgi:Na+-driven multidrug efflux pump
MTAYAFVTGLVLVVWPGWILHFFSSDPAVVEIGAPYLRILGFAQPLMAVEIVLEHAFAGAGDTVPPMIISVPMNAVRVPLLLWLLHSGAGLIAIGWVLCITCMARGVLATLWFRRGGWKTRQI